MRISDGSSDVCSSDLRVATFLPAEHLVLDADIGEGAAHHHFMVAAARTIGEIGGASCRERVCQYVSISVAAVSLKKKARKPYKRHIPIHRLSLDAQTLTHQLHTVHYPTNQTEH